MSSRARALRLVGGVLRSPGHLARALPNVVLELEESVARDRVRRKHGLSAGLRTVDLLDLFADFDETVTPYAYLEGSSLPTDIALLRLLARRTAGCCYFEIGAWRGESLRNVASVARECVSLSLSGRQSLRGVSSAWVDQYHFFSKDLPNVTYFDADSTTFDFEQYRGRVDLVFVDGSHAYEAVVEDTRNALTLLRDERSVVVWHDYGKSPERVRWSVLEAILDGCTPDQRRHLYHVSNTLCAIWIRGEGLRAAPLSYPTTPDKTFDLTIRTRRLSESSASSMAARP